MAAIIFLEDAAGSFRSLDECGFQHLAKIIKPWLRHRPARWPNILPGTRKNRTSCQCDPRMILSVVIVSFNVKFFLEQCLSSLKKAVAGSDLLRDQTEVFIVDNASADGSLDLLRPLFPEFQFIQNQENRGFARANNQALSLCRGEYILFLNPDTILAEDGLDGCISFFGSNPDAGALGIHMVDGSGRFLRESKRGFPGAAASFFKMTGFARLFPHSKVFSSYYLGHLDERHAHPVDILSGAFLMTKKSVLNKTGDFDEQFFMYGEDIDLSYRIRQAGFQNYYFAGSSIIHFKGESTRKDFQYVNLFYAAMILFMKKHGQGLGASIRRHFLTLAVRLHQSMAYFSRLPWRKKETVSFRRARTVIRDEAYAQKIWSQPTEKENARPSADPDKQKEILFCEGPQLSWKRIIQEISNHPGEAIYLFQGSDTHAVVSSFSSKFQGEVFEV